MTKIEKRRVRQKTNNNFFFHFQEITDFGITGNGQGYPMSRLENLQKFDLFAKSDGITDESLRHISGLKNIKQVNIPRSKSVSLSKNPIFNTRTYCFSPLFLDV